MLVELELNLMAVMEGLWAREGCGHTCALGKVTICPGKSHCNY